MMLPGEVYETYGDRVTIRIAPDAPAPARDTRVVLMPAGQAWALWSACLFALLVMIIIGLANALTPPAQPSPTKSTPVSYTAEATR